MFKDLIWTLIIVWLVYKLIDVFRASHSKKQTVYSQTGSNPKSNQEKPNKHSAIKKGADKEGDYVDFEEIK
ncbi:MAG: hypothetical protein ACK5QC_07115 [Bacteroidota bacterium]|jgi:hypothetical protein|nr:hypothetical protein [Bacteroidota bacterium]MCA6444711.1 hypothetical protein [Bacteroidota bacterium]